MSLTPLEIFYLFALLFIVGIIVVTIKIVEQTNKEKQPASLYKYRAKDCYMTKTEADFFKILDRSVGNQYYIFPQAHLSAILNHKITGQNWKAAFRHINGKSVDYVLCDKQTLKPIYAVELDDYTHEYYNRQKRDQEVERMLQSANIPLVRFGNYKELNQEEIAKRFVKSNDGPSVYLKF